MNLDETLIQIKNLSPETLTSHGVISVAKAVINGKPTYICPYCDNGTGEDGTGIQPSYFNGVWLYHCFKCNETFDNINFLALYYQLDSRNKDDFKEIIRRAVEEFSILDSSVIYDNTPHPQRKEKSAVELAQENQELKFIRDDINNSQHNIENFLETVGGKWRGLTINTFQHFHCGYIANWVSPKSRVHNTFSTPTPRLIIPSGKHYLARLTIPIDSFDEKSQKYIIPKQHAGKKFPFNFESISTETINIIVEGEIDAMSIWQATNGQFPIIATSGISSYSEFVDLVKNKFTASDIKPRFLILFDSDESGKDTAPKFKEALHSAKFPAVYNFLSNELSKIDSNDILCEQGQESLATIIQSLISTAQIDIDKIIVEFAEESALQEKISDWIKINGDVSPEILSDLKKAVKYLQSLNVENITSSIANQSATIYNIALCRFYDFYIDIAENFLARVSVAKERAKAKIKASKISGEQVDDSVNAMASIVPSEINEKINSALSIIKKKHKKFQETLDTKKSIAEREQKINSENEYRQNQRNRITELKKLPPTPKRNAAIIRLINICCDWNLDKSGRKISVRAGIDNYKLIFENDPNIDGLFGYDEFQQSDVFLKRPIWKRQDNFKPYEPLQDSDDANLRFYLRDKYKDISNEKLCADVVVHYSTERSFHPIKNWFKSLPQWDGQERAETLFIKFLRVADTKFAREVTMKWLTAAVARIFYPGCNFQNALILKGNQNIGKSYILEKLGGAWYGILSDSVDDSHAIDAIQNVWIIELKEMSAMRKAEVNAQKSFIERSFDNRRAAYAKRAQISKRSCVFAITVNDEQFLHDKTGNRRYWILESPSAEFNIVLGLTEEYIHQIWAEVYFKFQQLTADGFNDKILQISKDLKQQAEEIAENFVVDDGLQGEIQAFLNTPIPPPIIWNLLTKEERRKFIAEGKIIIMQLDLDTRAQKLKQREKTAYQETVDNYCHQIERPAEIGKSVSFYVIHGIFYRNETCATEIYNECFGNDRRKSIFRIREILSKLDGWHRSDTSKKNFAMCYGDQRNIYLRNEKIPNIEIEKIEYIDDIDVPF